MAIEADTNIRFKQDSRFGDWKKGEEGTVERVLALPPQNQLEVYIVKTADRRVWATNKDIEPWNQMTLF